MIVLCSFRYGLHSRLVNYLYHKAVYDNRKVNRNGGRGMQP